MWIILIYLKHFAFLNSQISTVTMFALAVKMFEIEKHRCCVSNIFIGAINRAFGL